MINVYTGINTGLALLASLAAFGALNKMQFRQTRPCVILAMLLIAIGLAGQALGLLKTEWAYYADTALYGGVLALLLASQRVQTWFLERWANPIATVIGSLILVVFMVGLLTGCEARAQGAAKPDIVEVIEVSGVIGDGTSTAVQAQVEKINEQPRIKAVVLVIDSPGGGALASSALYETIAEIKAPVVAWCRYICASGGLYAVMAPSVKHVMVRSDTITGSVGVIMQATRYHRLLDWAKVDMETYKSGALKDAGNPTRPGQDDERKYLQSIVDDLAVKFYAVVAKGRSNGVKDWAAVKSARIFIGDQAVQVGLVDSIGSRDDAIRKAKALSGSKLIFTREELKKMSKDANDTTVYSAPVLQPQAHGFGDIASLIELVKEIRQGESTTFMYVMPYRF